MREKSRPSEKSTPPPGAAARKKNRRMSNIEFRISKGKKKENRIVCAPGAAPGRVVFEEGRVFHKGNLPVRGMKRMHERREDAR